MAFWLWLERVGFRHVVFRLLRLPILLINELAEEALTALACIVSDHPPPPPSDEYNNNIPLTQNFMKKEISLQFLYANRHTAFEGVAKIRNEVCFRAMKDIMIQAISHRQISTAAAAVTAPPPPPSGVGDLQTQGYPVHEWEVREFFNTNYGDCIENFQMQEVEANEQALFARIVFKFPSTIDLILRGQPRMKFTINGKHIWARKFIPKQRSSPPPPPPSPPPSAVAPPTS
ncbi:uncharacterized protein E6C27_scaffold181G001620 [Cucumis melo var. makuwa]|uniref:CACTA en-spm transposon protein n=1 Tax=Cucumis melo var. makuwa TaxID=1194695 RepID=A0A5A7UNB1_CUCMM|nr:uncharacterized protein E6C27_scaffold181G001620 [Cucumis melo var. makuwa]